MRQGGPQGPRAEPAVRADQGVPPGAASPSARVPAVVAAVGVQADHPVGTGTERVEVEQHGVPAGRGGQREGAGEGGRAGPSGPTHHADGAGRVGTAVGRVGEQLDQPGVRSRELDDVEGTGGQGRAEEPVGDRPVRDDVHLVASRRTLRGDGVGEVRPEEHDGRGTPAAQGSGRVMRDVEGGARRRREPEQVVEQQVVSRDQQRRGRHGQSLGRGWRRRHARRTRCGRRAAGAACARDRAGKGRPPVRGAEPGAAGSGLLGGRAGTEPDGLGGVPPAIGGYVR